MFLPSTKAMCLRRDVCLRHVADSLRVRPPYNKNNRGCGCFLSMTNKKERLFEPKRGQASTGI